MPVQPSMHLTPIMGTSLSLVAPTPKSNNQNEDYTYFNQSTRSSSAFPGSNAWNVRTQNLDNYYPYQPHQHAPSHNNRIGQIYSLTSIGHRYEPSTLRAGPIVYSSLPSTPSTVRPSTDSASPRVPAPVAAPSIPRFPLQPVSVNYQGNRFALRNQSANILPQQSTSVWITNLPPEVDYEGLLGGIRNVGKVYATVINPPQGNFVTSAAKIVFFDVEARQRFEALSAAGSLYVGGYSPRVRQNRILTATQRPGPESRVLHITGPATLVNHDRLLAYFRSWCAFDLETYRTTPTSNGYATMTWAFGSYRCQAERVFAAIRGLRVSGVTAHGRNEWASVIVNYGPDPCDRKVSRNTV